MKSEKNKKNTGSLREKAGMLLALLKIGIIGFGGGSALIPVIEKEVVEERKLITPEEYNKDVVVACITPGALPMEISTGLGKRAYGIGGMILSALMLAFPGALLTVALLTILSKVSNTVLTQIEILSIGISAFIICLLTEYARKTLAEARKESKGRWKRAVVILFGVFILSGGKSVYKLLGIDADPLFCLSTLQVLGIAFFGILYTSCKFTKKNLLISGSLIAAYIFTISQSWFDLTILEWVVKGIMTVLSIYGLCHSLKKSTDHLKLSPVPMIKEVVAWTLFMVILSIPAVILNGDTLLYLGKGLLSSILSFGGGDAYLTVADGMFVADGMIPSDDFYGHLVPLVNLLPGSILCKTLSGVGYILGYEAGGITEGWLVAMAGFSASVMASGTVFCVVYYIYECFENLDVFRLLGRWIRPIIGGLLLNVMCSLFAQNIRTGQGIGCGTLATIGITLLIYVANLLLLYVKKCKNGMLIVASIILCLVSCNLVLFL